jgi:hypothetical protein
MRVFGQNLRSKVTCNIMISVARNYDKLARRNLVRAVQHGASRRIPRHRARAGCRRPWDQPLIFLTGRGIAAQRKLIPARHASSRRRTAGGDIILKRLVLKCIRKSLSRVRLSNPLRLRRPPTIAGLEICGTRFHVKSIAFLVYQSISSQCQLFCAVSKEPLPATRRSRSQLPISTFWSPASPMLSSERRSFLAIFVRQTARQFSGLHAFLACPSSRGSLDQTFLEL